jgi:hypothetical protein
LKEIERGRIDREKESERKGERGRNG